MKGIIGSIISFVGFLTYVGIGLKTILWYSTWWDRILEPPLGSLVGVLTYPIFPLAVIIEWIWFRWPAQMTTYFWISMGALAATSFGSFLSRKP